MGQPKSFACQIRVFRIMHSVASVPVTAAVFAALTLLLSGCIAYDAVGRMADTRTILVSPQGELALDR
jgi:hypothetical protein